MLTLKSPAKDKNPRLYPAVQRSKTQSVNQDMVLPEPLPLRQCNSNTSAHLEYQDQSQTQQEMAAQPLRGNPYHIQTSVDHKQQQSLLDRGTEEKPQAHPVLNKSHSPLISAFGLKDTPFFRTDSEDTESKGTIHNLRKSFASLFSE
ncbi:hypothetical protein PAMP_012261 [Pampus punctatissimus]